MSGAFGDRGERWLTELPEIIDACVARWDLRLGDPYPDPSYQIVYRATGPSGDLLALKLGVPRGELRDEAFALRSWGGRGAVRLVADDPAAGALLLERLEPGTQLADVAVVDDDEATKAGAAVFRRIAEAGFRDDWEEAKLAVPPVQTLADWGLDLDRHLMEHGDDGPLPRGIVQSAATAYSSLHASTDRKALLHGDLHHHNILLAAGREEAWVAIDPKGIIGDPAFEVGAFLRNPGAAFGPGTDGAARTRRRIDLIVDETGLDRMRLVDWAWAGSVLSAVWCVSEEGREGSSWSWPIQVADWILAAR